ncbi:hypothetical protein FOE67_19585 [Streptomyces calidiresistens]|uniref:Mycothiol-dependent maleylpyruvate isomerase metal-binding domain-containing protein n=2 Tax=Streptomyces calidiresistens TaxID=1485586 RepID=A0A7W3T6N6_9ACTN|nr:hypothetical protein [Streptomyces calidiresistens]
MVRKRAVPPAVDVWAATRDAFVSVLVDLDEERSRLPSGCAGWAVRDLVFHCLCDLRRGLVALHTPADREPDRDAVDYWADWVPGTDGSPADRKLSRIVAELHPDFTELRDLYAETSAALLHAAAGTAPGERVATQGHVLTADDLVRTLAVEATIHHLDLIVSLPGAPGPSPEGLAEVRRTLDGLLGHPAPEAWDDARYALIATGRAALSDAEAGDPGVDAGRFPLFG